MVAHWPSEVKQVFSPKQSLAWQTLMRDDIQDELYGGGKGGGKSYLGCWWCFNMCNEYIEKYNVKPRKFAIPVGFMGRKRGVDFKSTTLQTWKKFIPPEYYEIKEGAQEIIIRGVVKIDYGGLDSTETVAKFNSAEYGFIFIDQAEETVRDDVSVLMASRRLIINGQKVPPKGLWTANPRQCWLQAEFINNPEPNKIFIQALPADNPYLGDEYVRVLKDSFKHRPDLLKAYLYGSWDSMAAADQLILDNWIVAAMSVTFHPVRDKNFLVCDVARFGDDETVIDRFRNTKIIDQEIYGKKSTTFTANRLHTKAIGHKTPAQAVVIDGDGVGGGVVDQLREMSNGLYRVIEINSARKSKILNIDKKPKYYNIRAEMWDHVARKFDDGNIEIEDMDSTTRTQLCTPTYTYRNGMILIESKADIKKRIGRSPDQADTFIMGQYIESKLDFDPLPEDNEYRAIMEHRERMRFRNYDPLAQ